MSSSAGETVFDKMTRCFTLKTGAITVSTLHIVIGILLTIETIYSATYSFHSRVTHASQDELHLVYSFGTSSSMQLIFGIYMFKGVLKGNVTYILSGLTLDVMTFLMGLTSVGIPIFLSIHQGIMFDNFSTFLIDHAIMLGFEVIFIAVMYKYYRRLVKETPSGSPAELVNSREPDDVEVEYF